MTRCLFLDQCHPTPTLTTAVLVTTALTLATFAVLALLRIGRD